MTHEEFYFLKLAEECAEVAQRASKLLQFGPDEVQEGQGENNLQRLRGELNDLLSIVEILESEYDLPRPSEEEMVVHYLAKREKLAKYLALSEKLGRVK